ncbi:MAG: cytochrome b/b6 domain-containing protein [Proteobacteria bacterium]|nr:MAG: cytochrome b/b6 domain-containing protein [Pseudomonadota bacterium]
MNGEQIEHVRIWSPWLRACHWAIAVGVLFQVASSWGMTRDAVDPAFWRDWHVIVGQLMTLALAARAVLMFFPGTCSWRELAPRRSELAAITQMIKFYLTFTRFPLPAWFAHNPFWKPLYLAVLVLLALSALSGLLFHSPYPLAGRSAPALHAAVATPIAAFALFHVVAVFLHDLKGRGAFVSAMIGGGRYVHVDRGGPFGAGRPKGPVSVSVDAIKTPDKTRRTP